MTWLAKWLRLRSALWYVGLPAIVAVLWGAPAAQPASQQERDRTVLSQSLPNLNGSHLKVVLVEVTYRPGESSRPHSHPCPVIGYVIEGALRTKVAGEPENVYKAGESFYEAPNGIHEISANASQKERTKFLAYFVCDRDTPLSVAPPTSRENSAGREESVHEP